MCITYGPTLNDIHTQIYTNCKVRLSVEDYKSYFTQQTKQIHDRKNNNEAITSNEAIKTMKQSRTMKSCFD